MGGEAVKPVQARAILVLGMHRSGTSALTRVLNLLGADISTNLMGAATGNETGFWESVDAYEIHQRLLSELRREWFDVSPLPVGWLATPAADRAAGELTDLLARDFATSQLWVMKDPRMCRLVPLWRRVLAGLDIKLLPVLMVRHPEEVATSLYKMVGEHHRMPEGAVYTRLLWVQHLLEAEHDTRDLKRAMVTYDQLLSDWKGTVVRIARELDFSWPHGINAAAAEIDAFLMTSQRHHKANTAGVKPAGDDPDLAQRLYLACTNDDRTGHAWKKLRQLRKAYDDGMTIVGPGFGEWTSRAALELTEARSSSEQLANKLAVRSSELYDCRLQLLQRDAELEQVRAALAEQVALVSERSEALYEHRQQLLQRDAELEQVRAALAGQAALVSERSEALYEHRQQLQLRDAELEQVRAALTEQAALVSERSEALYEHRQQLQQRDAELEQVRTALAEQVALVSERSQALYEHRQQLQQRDAELEQVRSALTRQFGLSSRLEHQLTECQLALQAREVDLAQLGGEHAQLSSSLNDLQLSITSKRWLFARLLNRPKMPD